MCVFCNNNYPTDTWTASYWCVAHDEHTEDCNSITVCANGPHEVPRAAAQDSARDMLNLFGMGMLEIFDKLVVVDQQLTSDNYIFGFTTKHSNIHGILSGEISPEAVADSPRCDVFLIHRVADDPQRILSDLQTLAELDFALDE